MSGLTDILIEQIVGAENQPTHGPMVPDLIYGIRCRRCGAHSADIRSVPCDPPADWSETILA